MLPNPELGWVAHKTRPKQGQVKGLCQEFVLNGVEFWGFKCRVGLLVASLVSGGAVNQVLNESEDPLINPPDVENRILLL